MKKIFAIILATIIAVSALSLAVSAYAMPFMNWRNFQQGNMAGNMRRIAAQQSSVRVNGLISQLGNVNVTGIMEAQSRTLVLNSSSVRQGSTATAMWTTNNSRPISSVRARENFSYTFYTARLTEASLSSLNVTGYSYFLNGTWNVFQVNSSFNITTDSSGNVTGFSRNQNAVAVAMNAYGELTVSSNGNSFTLSIKGVNPLTGSVHVQRISTRLCNPFKINNDDTSITVTPADVSTIVASYGSSPGWGNYDQRMDYNFNYKVDICDLATAAANINS
jgi:hypothetical protein